MRSRAPEPTVPLSPGIKAGLAAALACQIILLIIAALRNKERLNTDGIAYLRIASYYATGQSHLMISGYWGPLLSWIMTPYLALGAPQLLAARMAMAFSAVVFWFGCLSVFLVFRLSSISTLFGAWIVAAASVFWSVEYISPDLLVAGLMNLAIAGLVSRDWIVTPAQAVRAGAFWALAYLAKAVALPFALLVSLGIAGCWLASGMAHAKSIIRSLAISLTTLALLASPWIVVLSVKYHRFTFSTSARIAHAIAGPPDGERYHPFGRMFHRPEPGRITSWEDPSLMPYRYWSPFENTKYAAHQLNLITANLQLIIQLLSEFDALSLGSLALLGCVIVRPPLRQRLSLERWRWALVPAVCIVAIYLPVRVQRTDTRYFYVLYPWLWVAAVGIASWFLSRIRRAWPQRVALGLVFASFSIPALLGLAAALEGLPDPASILALTLAEKLRAAEVRGPMAGSGMVAGGRSGLYLAFLLNEPWYGDETPLTVTGLKKSAAQLVIIPRHHPLNNELKLDPSFRDLDERLFASREEAEQFPLKVYQLLAPH